MSVVWSNQWEPSTKAQPASSCYVANFGAAGHSNQDIELAIDADEANPGLIPEADMIVGGFPCQDYSVAKSSNSALGLVGKKGVLWWQIHRLVSRVKPKFVFLENVDRLLKSPSSQRGRDFAVMLRTLGNLGYVIEWRVINSADYGHPQRRLRVFLVAIREDIFRKSNLKPEFVSKNGLLAKAFEVEGTSAFSQFELGEDVEVLSLEFNKFGSSSPFKAAGFYENGEVRTWSPISKKETETPLGAVLIPDSEVPDEFFIDESRLHEWQYLKGAKSISRVSKTGHKYSYAEGKMAFPDSLLSPSRTILTGEGGSSPSRFKHVIEGERGLRRLTPVELERLNGFPDDWTKFDEHGRQISDAKRAFFMGNALVVGLVEAVGREIVKFQERVA